MASEAAILNKYAKVCKSQACCEHTRFNRCNFEDTSNRNSNNREWNIDRNVNGNGADVKTDAVCKIYENIIYFLCTEYRMFIPSRIYTTHCVFVFFFARLSQQHQNQQQSTGKLLDDNGNEMTDMPPTTICRRPSDVQNDNVHCCCKYADHLFYFYFCIGLSICFNIHDNPLVHLFFFSTPKIESKSLSVAVMTTAVINVRSIKLIAETYRLKM